MTYPPKSQIRLPSLQSAKDGKDYFVLDIKKFLLNGLNC